MSRRSLPILLAALAALLTVTTGVALNVATGGTLPASVQGYRDWAWPVVGLLTLAVVTVSVLQVHQPLPTGSPPPMEIRTLPQRVVGERVSTAVDVFRNRTEFCARLRALVLTRSAPIISVTGRRGIGKSGLVAKVMADFEEPTNAEVDGLAYLSTRTGVGVLDLARIFHALVRLLPAEARDRLEEQWANSGSGVLPDLFAALAGRRAVLVLDNLDDLQDARTGQLTSPDLVLFLTAVCRARRPPVVVTTSQRPLGVPPEIGAHIVRIEIDQGLAADDAVELLRGLDADGEAGLRDLPEAELREAVKRVHGMPRGLELLVSLLAEHRTATVQRIFDARDTPEVLLGRLVSEGFHSHDAVGRDVLRVLALAGTPLPMDALPEILAGMHPAVAVTATAEQLANRRMVGFDRATRQARLHPIDSDYVRRTLLDDPDQSAALDLRLADWLATRHLPADAWRTSTDVAAQRRETRHRLRAGDQRGALRVLADIAEFLAGRGETEELNTALDQLRDFADDPAYALSYGVTEFLTGSLEEAVTAFRAGRDAAEQAGDQLLTAKLDMFLGNALRHMGRPAEAREPLVRAGLLPPEGPEARAVAMRATFLLGLVACYLGDVAAATEVAARYDRMLRPDDSSLWWGSQADLRALIALAAGDHATALAEAERGMARYTDSPDQASSGYLANVRGLVLLARGDLDAAAKEFRGVVADAALLRQARLEGFAALNLAWTMLRLGDRTGAAATARHAAERLHANRVSEAPSADELAAACEAADPETRRSMLRAAVRAAHGNPDLYQPPDEVLDG